MAEAVGEPPPARPLAPAKRRREHPPHQSRGLPQSFLAASTRRPRRRPAAGSPAPAPEAATGETQSRRANGAHACPPSPTDSATAWVSSGSESRIIWSGIAGAHQITQSLGPRRPGRHQQSPPPRPRRPRPHAHSHLGDHPQTPLAPQHQLAQIRAGRGSRQRGQPEAGRQEPPTPAPPPCPRSAPSPATPGPTTGSPPSRRRSTAPRTAGSGRESARGRASALDRGAERPGAERRETRHAHRAPESGQTVRDPAPAPAPGPAAALTPPVTDVPPPNGITRTPCRAHSSSTASTSSASRAAPPRPERPADGPRAAGRDRRSRGHGRAAAGPRHRSRPPPVSSGSGRGSGSRIAAGSTVSRHSGRPSRACSHRRMGFGGGKLSPSTPQALILRREGGLRLMRREFS